MPLLTHVVGTHHLHWRTSCLASSNSITHDPRSHHGSVPGLSWHAGTGSSIAVSQECSMQDSLVVKKNGPTSRTNAMPDVPLGRISGCLVQHWLFKDMITVIVVLGAIQMGLETALQNDEFKRAWEIWDVCYTVISTVEMICMIESYRSTYFTTSWMLMDFLLAVASILSTFVLPAVHELRFIRLFRVLRIIKVTKVFPGFAVIIDGLKDSFLSMFWIFGLLLLILYAAGIFCVDVLGGQDAGYPGYNESVGDSNSFNNFVYFGTLLRSMLTLLSMLLLSEWAIMRDIAVVNMYMVPFFLFLLVLVTFGVLNLIIGIVVEKTIAAMNRPQHEEQMRDAIYKACVSEELSELFEHIDTDSDGRASLCELEGGLQQSPGFADKLQSLDLPYDFTVMEFLCMLDLDGNGVLSKNEFVSGLLRLIFSNDWQRECLHSMEIGMLRQAVMRIAKDLKQELRCSVTALQSEVRLVMRLRSLVAPTNSEACQSYATGSLVSETPRSPSAVASQRAGSQHFKGSWEHIPDITSVKAGGSYCRTAISTKAMEERTVKVDMLKVNMPRVGIDSTSDAVSLETETWERFPHFPRPPLDECSDEVGCRALIERDDVIPEFDGTTLQNKHSNLSSQCSYDILRSQGVLEESRAVGSIGSVAVVLGENVTVP